MKHDCCDICLAASKCSSYSTVEKPSDVKPADETVEMETLVRHVQEEDRAFLYEMRVLGSAGLVFQFGEQVIEAIVSKYKYIH